MNRKILSFVFSAIALFAPTGAYALDHYSPQVAKSVRHEFGGIRQDYFTSGRVSDQVMMGLGIPDPTKPLTDGNYLISGCRHHNCPEKSAVIVTPAGTMLAAGLIHFRCTPRDCDSVPHLTIFMTKRNDRPAFVQELQDWAAREGYKGAAERQTLR
ncbi:MAG TPA: hypothetical protein VLL04_01620 [Rhizomicrobium sp.]|nr:hypothetical protein [Rhizomicrobium sp.]